MEEIGESMEQQRKSTYNPYIKQNHLQPAKPTAAQEPTQYWQSMGKEMHVPCGCPVSLTLKATQKHHRKN